MKVYLSFCVVFAAGGAMMTSGVRAAAIEGPVLFDAGSSTIVTPPTSKSPARRPAASTARAVREPQRPTQGVERRGQASLRREATTGNGQQPRQHPPSAPNRPNISRDALQRSQTGVSRATPPPPRSQSRPSTSTYDPRRSAPQPQRAAPAKPGYQPRTSVRSSTGQGVVRDARRGTNVAPANPQGAAPNLRSPQAAPRQSQRVAGQQRVAPTKAGAPARPTGTPQRSVRPPSRTLPKFRSGPGDAQRKLRSFRGSMTPQSSRVR